MTNIVIAQVKGKAGNSLVQFKTEETLFNESGSNVPSTCPMKQNFNYKLWSKKFQAVSNEAFFPDFLKSGKVSGPFPEIRKEQFQQILWIGESHVDAVYFQRVLPSVNNRTVDFSLKKAIQLDIIRKLLITKGTPDSVYQISTDTLFHRNFPSLESVFTGIHMTIDDSPCYFLGTFLNARVLFNINQLSSNDFSPENRKKMTHLHYWTDHLSKKERTSLVYYVTETYQSLIPTPSYGEFVVRDNKELTLIVEALDETLFAAEACEQRRRKIFNSTPGFEI